MTKAKKLVDELEAKNAARKDRVAKARIARKAEELEIGTSDPILLSLYRDLRGSQDQRLKTAINQYEVGLITGAECVRQMLKNS
jgi:hypothetical protein